MINKYTFLVSVALFLLSQQLVAQNEKPPLLGSWPVSFTPLSLWNSDISTSVGGEYRFHPSFSVRTAADYIYGNYTGSSYKTSGGRLRQEVRYYIAGNRLINSRSRVWPYIAIAGGGKYVRTAISEWHWQNTPSGGYSVWQTYRTINREWFIMGKTGMQTAFGKDKRFLFDISLAFGSSNNNVAYRLPGNDGNTAMLPFAQPNLFVRSSDNIRSGKFTAVNFEACFGYRLLK